MNFLTRVYTKSFYNNEKKSMLQKNLFERSILKAVNPANVEDERHPGLIPGSEDPLEKEMATHSSILGWKIPWTEEPDGLWFIGSQSQTQLKQLSTQR